jgi:NADH-quinone oxidoreductase subunit N
VKLQLATEIYAAIIKHELLMFLPFIVISVGAFYLLFADLFKLGKMREKLLFSIAMAVCLLAAAIYIPSLKDGLQSFFHNSMFVADPFTNFLGLLLVCVLGLSIVLSKDFLAKTPYKSGEFYSLMFFSALGMLLLSGANNLIIVFIGLEIMSIPLYILTGFLKDDLSSKEAAMKYFILGAFSTGIFAMGVAFIYGATGTMDLHKIAMNTGVITNHLLFIAGLGMLLVGFGFKIALVPFHMWVPDVYEGAPTAVVAFMSVAVKISTFAIFVRVFNLSFGAYAPEFLPVLKIIAILSMTLGNLAAIYQTNIKRMLAYSSIAHAGYILVAIVSAHGAALQIGISAIVFYLVAYAMMKLGAFSVVSFFEGKDKVGTKIEDYSGLGFKHPFIGLAMSVFMLSLAGIPLTAGFMGKLYVFGAAVKSGNLDLAIIGVINSMISVYYYLRIIVFMYMKDSQTDYKPKLGYATGLVILLAMLLVLFFGIWPKALLTFSDFISQVIA